MKKVTKAAYNSAAKRYESAKIAHTEAVADHDETQKAYHAAAQRIAETREELNTATAAYAEAVDGFDPSL